MIVVRDDGYPESYSTVNSKTPLQQLLKLSLVPTEDPPKSPIPSIPPELLELVRQLSKSQLKELIEILGYNSDNGLVSTLPPEKDVFEPCGHHKKYYTQIPIPHEGAEGERYI